MLKNLLFPEHRHDLLNDRRHVVVFVLCQATTEDDGPLPDPPP